MRIFVTSYFLFQHGFIQQSAVGASAQCHVGHRGALKFDQHIHVHALSGAQLPGRIHVSFAQSCGDQIGGDGLQS